MAKRKFIVDGQVDYIICHPIHAKFTVGWIKTEQKIDVEADVKIKNKKNLGGELWDWAQSHWDTFLDEEGPEVIIDGKPHKTLLRWCCVGGVFDANGKDLPIQETKWRNTHLTPKGIQAEKTGKKKISKRLSKSSSSKPSTKTTNKPKSSAKTPSQNSSTKKSSNNVLSFDEMKAKKIEEALAKEE